MVGEGKAWRWLCFFWKRRERTSFLKKRSKKLLSIACSRRSKRVTSVPPETDNSLLVLLSKKNTLSCFLQPCGYELFPRNDSGDTGMTKMAGSIYEAAGGSKAFIALAAAWHARCQADPIVSHAFSHGYHPLHAERLAAYWAEALGGPSAYTKSMGNESHVVRLHSGNGAHVEMDERAQVCFAHALDDAGIPHDPRLRATLKAYFRWATQTMSAYPRSGDDVPAGLPLPQWSWDGPGARDK